MTTNPPVSEVKEQTIIEEPEEKERIHVTVHELPIPSEYSLTLTIQGPINKAYSQLYNFVFGKQEERENNPPKSLRSEYACFQYPTRIIGFSYNTIAIARGKKSLDTLQQFESLQRMTEKRITIFHIGVPNVYITYKQKGKKRRNQGSVIIRFMSDAKESLEQRIQEFIDHIK